MTLCVGLVRPATADAQEQPVAPLSLGDAVQLALKNYPLMRETRAHAAAAEAAVDVSRTAYLPRLDLLWQENRATTNNVFGLLLPQQVVPPLTGPVLGTRSLGDSVWGSAAGALLTWEAVDFGQRKSRVEAARAESARARSERALTELDVAATAADAFLTVLAADERVRAARANVIRLDVFDTSVRALVQHQLRPGADLSRAEAELAVAKNDLSRAMELATSARASLADAVGMAGATVEIVPGSLRATPDTAVQPGDVKSHPAAMAGKAAVDATMAREQAIDRAYLPKISLQSAFAVRGTGAVVPGVESYGNGLWPQVPNWAVGASISFPAFEAFSTRAERRVANQDALAETARYERTLQGLTTAEVKARALLTSATEIARNTPVERQAATDGESQTRARYQSGLASIAEVADAQRLLAQAEADDAIARLSVWRALLAIAQAKGDLTPFLDRVGRH
jgi:outer membrane protein TolC